MSKRKLDSLERRAGFLRARVAGGDADGQDLSYDKAELSALLWAIQELGREPKEERRILTKHCQIGNTVIRSGCHWDTVIDRAEREYEYRQQETK